MSEEIQKKSLKYLKETDNDINLKRNSKGSNDNNENKSKFSSKNENNSLDHKDFTSEDLKEDEQLFIDPDSIKERKKTPDEIPLKINKKSAENIKETTQIQENAKSQSVQRNHYLNLQNLINNDSDDNDNDSEGSSSKKKNRVVSKVYELNKPSMERISEAENEDEKHNTINERHNEIVYKDDLGVDENFKEYINKNLHSSNFNENFDQVHQTESTYRVFKDNPHNQFFSPNKEQNNFEKNSTEKDRRVEDDLYEDAINRKKKKEMTFDNYMLDISLNANKTKISYNSHKIAINKVEKYIEYIVYTYDREKNKKISFIDLGYILHELKVFREIIKGDEQKTRKTSEYYSYKEINMELKNCRENEKRRKLEIDFYEQIWIILNPDNNDYIKSNILSEFIKILFSPVSSSIKEISSVIKQFLQTAFFLNSNQDNPKKHISPITEKTLNEDEVWTIEKLVKEFLNLKQNILAYQSIYNLGKGVISDLEKQNFSFVPQINKNYQNNREYFFGERLNKLLQKEKVKEEVYREAKLELEENELRGCTFKPAINKKSIGNNSNTEPIPVYDKLYKKHKEKKEKLESIKIQQEKNLEKMASDLPFKPVLCSTVSSFNRSINSEKPRGYEDAVQRIKSGIQKKKDYQELLNYVPKGENYEKLKKSNIQPFNITDLKKKSQEDLKSKKKNDDDYFSIQISIAKGKERLLKIHRYDNPEVVAENFCRVYGLKKEIIERLKITIQDCMNAYLLNSENLEIHNNIENNDFMDNIDTNAMNNLNTNHNQTQNLSS